MLSDKNIELNTLEQLEKDIDILTMDNIDKYDNIDDNDNDNENM